MIADQQLVDVIVHAMGLDQYGRGGRSGRNSFVTGPGSTDWPAVQELVRRGLMEDFGPQKLYAGSHALRVTPAGLIWMDEHTPPPPEPKKLTRSQKRYQMYRRLELTESFGEYIKNGIFRSCEERWGLN